MGYYITLANGDRVPVEGGGLIDNVKVLTGVTTLRIEDSGSEFSLKGATAGAAITLPGVALRFSGRFYVGALFATTNWTIVAPTAVIQGGAVVNSVFVPAANETTVSFVATADTLGDYVDIHSDGTNYYASGIGAQAGSVTFT